MTKQKSPHTQTQQNVVPEQSDFEPDQNGSDVELYRQAEGAETGMNRSPRKMQSRTKRRVTEPPTGTYEGRVTTRTPKQPRQGITSHSAKEESERQEKVVKKRSDAQAGVNRSKRRKAA
jgi:hypothetical protein